ncbi:glycosyltransferase [Paenibacillus validus]|uniref:glycosyltransferase n=1 Tax=Paenibacillus validus TaxID=44253 RepID=UPI000FDA579E|nr:glycosyltransferase [Paenibacillus validus]MED4601272.1 glycosyltransferase [Paenibacillus validus]MED4605784.1 glycosyltransferase [Paenibacillus validus]
MKVVQAFPYHGVTGVDRYISVLNSGLLQLDSDIEIINLIFCSSQEAVKHKEIDHPRVHYRFIECDMGIKLSYDPMKDCFADSVTTSKFEHFLDEEKPDVINFQHLSDLGVSLLGVAKEKGVSTVVTLHDYWSICPRSFLINSDLKLCDGPNLGARCIHCFDSAHQHVGTEVMPFVARYQFITDALDKKADLIVTVSDAIRNRLLQEGLNDKKVVSIHTSLDSLDRTSLKINHDKNGVTFGFIGNLLVHKGPHILLEAFRQLNDPHSRLVIYGSIDPLYRPTIEKVMGSIPNVFWKGSYQSNELEAIFDEIDVLVVPTICPEQPLVILEALQYHTPVIGSNLGGIPEMIGPEFGALFEAGNIEQLLLLMKKITAFPEILTSWSKQIPVLPSVETFCKKVYDYYKATARRRISPGVVKSDHLSLLGPQDKGFLRRPMIPRQIKRIEAHLYTVGARKVAIFGTGHLGLMIYRHLVKRDVKIISFIDNDPKKWDQVIDGIPVTSPTQITDIVGLEMIIIVSDWEIEIMEQLESMELNVPVMGFYSY